MNRPRPQFHLRRYALLVLLPTLALGACSSLDRPSTPGGPSPDVPAPCNPALCAITDAGWMHIESRHCPPIACAADNKSVFVPAHCVDKPAGIAFCRAVMNAPGCAPTQQGNGRVAYQATLAANVGQDRDNACAMTMDATVIHDPATATVVTQFPGNP